jgi:hypothetical protein
MTRPAVNAGRRPAGADVADAASASAFEAVPRRAVHEDDEGEVQAALSGALGGDVQGEFSS